MPTRLDHLIVRVNDVEKTAEFYTSILGLTAEGSQDPFTVVRVDPHLILLLAPWGTQGGEHFAFAMSGAEFEATWERVRAAGIDYGDKFHDVGNMQGPGEERGARGLARTLYFFDPNRHLIEIRCYPSD